MSEYNPIWAVDGNTDIPCPSSYEITYSDVSGSDAGRTEDLKMHKNKLGEVVSIKLSWRCKQHSDVNKILWAFDPEYVNVTYCDPKYGKGEHYRATRRFYTGDKTAPMYNARLRRWENLSFDLIAEEKS